MQAALIALSTALLLTGPQQVAPRQASPQPYTMTGRISVFEDIEVPALEAGQLVELKIPLADEDGNPVVRQGQPVYRVEDVREGVAVRRGERIGRIDDALEIAQKTVTERRLEVARKEAENKISVDYAQATLDVSKAELEQARAAISSYGPSVSAGELRRLELTVREAQLRVQQAEHDLQVAGLTAKVGEAEDAVAAQQIQRRKIIASSDGIVVRRFKDVGEWVQPGETVLQMVRVDRVKIECSALAGDVLPFQLQGREVTVRLHHADGTPARPGEPDRPLGGRVYFASPIAESGTSDFRVLVEVENVWVTPDPGRAEEGYWLLWPGLHADVTVDLTKTPGAR
jgi:hypothetical protein